MFCILALCFKGVEGGEAQSISGYDCSAPENLKIWDAATRCKKQAERKLEGKEVTIVQRIQLRNVPKCFRDFPIMERKGKKFVSASNRMLMDNSAEEVCVPHFTRMVRGEKSWYRVEPGVRRTRTLRQEGGFSLKHCDDEVRLYTEAEKHELDHIQGSAGPQLYRADIGAAGGWITMIQWLGWLIPVIWRTRRYIVRSQGRWQVEAAEGASLQH